ncbi:MAG: group II intron reverse transcriptase/maturase [Candidatus Thiodiazotropha endolucinida]
MARSYDISKQVVWQAYQRVKANKGAAGIDGQTIEDFEQDLKRNLYKIWNRLTSGCYQPPAVKAVRIPKRTGGTRVLGIPTVSDRIAQMVVKMALEPELETYFHEDSYGYRPGKSALQAVSKTRQRYMRYGWLYEFDIKGAFDNIDHELLLRALKRHTDCKWVLMYIERWLIAPMQHSDGQVEQRTKGTPQGGVISPLLMNLFLHYVFDKWMAVHEPRLSFARYADDAVVHCSTLREAQRIEEVLKKRFQECKLELHPEKSKIVCCKANRPGIDYPVNKFEFLGYEFRLRTAVTRDGRRFVSMLPAISPSSAKAIRKEIRSWGIQNRSDKSIDDLSRMFGAKLRGWINYYGHFYQSALYPTFYNLNRKLVKWATRKYKKLRRRPRRAHYWLGAVAKRQPDLFAHWQLLGLRPAIGITGAG